MTYLPPMRRPTLALLLTFLACVPPHRAAPRASAFTIYFIDVEGGQATLLVTPRRESFLIDAGFPGDGTFSSQSGAPATARDAQRIAAAARDAGVTRIDHLLVTHYHADHVGGVPEVGALLPIGEFIDRAAPTADAERAVGGTQRVYDNYVRTRGDSPHRAPRPGDRLPLADVDVTVLSSDGETVRTPIAGATASAGGVSCNDALPAQEKTENPRSLGVLVQFGTFRFLDLGDLTGAPLHALTCPVNMIGGADVYLVAHHGGDDAAAAAIFRTVRPRVAVLNNGARKGGAATTLATMRLVPALDVWQLHRATAAGVVNVDDARIANLDETTFAWLKLSARRDGSFTVTNARTGTSVTYPAHP